MIVTPQIVKNGDSERVARELLAGEGLLLSEAAKLLPVGRAGKAVNPSSIWRWAKSGTLDSNGERVYLEVCRIGCRTYTSKAAIERFILAQNPGKPAPSQPPTSQPATPASAAHARRRERIAAAQDELTRAGI